jgi:hypothetical protein
MSDQTDTLGGRLPLADPASLNPAFLIGIYHSVCARLTMFAIPAPE